MAHDYVRHGTTTLFAALNVLNGTVLGCCMQRHCHREIHPFFERDRGGGAGGQAGPRDPRQLWHHKHPKVMAWLDRHPR